MIGDLYYNEKEQGFWFTPNGDRENSYMVLSTFSVPLIKLPLCEVVKAQAELIQGGSGRWVKIIKFLPKKEIV